LPEAGSVLSSKIGLLAIRERMKAMNGRFDFVSAPQEGTTATLTVPLDSFAHGGKLGG
jgi:signal transduction histidine kinase